MEYINVVTQLIGSVGFPIVACIYMAVSAKETRNTHKEETSKMTEAINEMKLAITTLTERLSN